MKTIKRCIYFEIYLNNYWKLFLESGGVSTLSSVDVF